jgi:hypothetical protein
VIGTAWDNIRKTDVEHSCKDNERLCMKA